MYRSFKQVSRPCLGAPGAPSCCSGKKGVACRGAVLRFPGSFSACSRNGLRRSKHRSAVVRTFLPCPRTTTQRRPESDTAR